MKRKTTTHIIVHCSDSLWGDVPTVDRWHRERGFDSIGYHYLITNAHPTGTKESHPVMDGMVHAGRDIERAGAHAMGFNGCSVGVCLVGKTEFTKAQMDALFKTVRSLMKRYGIPASNVLGHGETPQSDKTCPNIDMAGFRQLLRRNA